MCGSCTRIIYGGVIDRTRHLGSVYVYQIILQKELREEEGKSNYVKEREGEKTMSEPDCVACMYTHRRNSTQEAYKSIVYIFIQACYYNYYADIISGNSIGSDIIL